MSPIGAHGGLRYLLRQVAGGEHDFRVREVNGSVAYYTRGTAHGEAPGRWAGRGCAALGVAGTVSEGQATRLFEGGAHPDTGEALGRKWRVYATVEQRIVRALAAEPDASAARRDEIRARIELAGEREARCGFDVTLSAGKSVSVLWALAGDDVKEQVLAAQAAAVDATLRYLDEHAGFTRAGVNGVRQLDTDGLVGCAYDHRMSRECDPQLHTHLVVSAKVRGVDGEWRSVDSTALHAASTGARIVYERALEGELGQRLGVRFDYTRTGSGIRELVGVPAELIGAFSKRRAAIEAGLGSSPEPAGGTEDGRRRWGMRAWKRRAQTVTLATRPVKDGVESTLEATSRWQAEARDLGLDPERVVTATLAPSSATGVERLTDEQVCEQALAALEAGRATWRREHVELAIGRLLDVDPARPTGADWVRVEALADALLTGGQLVELTPPELVEIPAELRRADGSDPFRRHRATVYTSGRLLNAEARLTDAARRLGAPTVQAEQVEQLLADPSTGLRPSADQAAAIRRLTTSDRRIEVLIGPAGTGKTACQRLVAAAYRDASVPVWGLAPSQAAAAELAEATGVRCENVGKFLFERRADARGRRVEADAASWRLPQGAVVLLDEAGMTATADLLAVWQQVEAAGGKLICVGDDAQLAAVEAGGGFALLARLTNAVELDTVRRFVDPDGTVRQWEAAASLRLRDRDPAALATYEAHGRIGGGPRSEMETQAYAGWLADLRDGQDAWLGVDTEQAAAELATRARAALVAAGHTEADGVQLADGTTAGVGDRVVTRRNDRRLVDETGRMVANRDAWTVVERSDDGTLTVSADSRGRVVLPADYVTAHVRLGYASTVHAAQGRTVDTARMLVSERTSAAGLYVGMTRGRSTNHAYVITVDDADGPEQHGPTQETPTALAVLAGVLAGDRPELSATETLVAEQTRAGSLATIGPRWEDLCATAAADRLPKLLVDLAGQQVARQVADSPGRFALARLLESGRAAGADPAHLLTQAAGTRELASADDPAKVLAWRVSGLLDAARSVPADPAGLASRPYADRSPSENAPAAEAARRYAAELDRRVQVLGELAAADPPAWAAALGPAPNDPTRRAVWTGRAGEVAAYRELAGLDHPKVLPHEIAAPVASAVREDVIGPAPAGRGEIALRWAAADRALRDARVSVRLADASSDELDQAVAAGRQAAAAEPVYVGDQLRSRAIEHRAGQALAAVLAEQLAAARTARAETEPGRLRRLLSPTVAAAATERAARLDRTIDTLAADAERVARRQRERAAEIADLATRQSRWESWSTGTTEIREAGQAAEAELALRIPSAHAAAGQSAPSAAAVWEQLNRARRALGQSPPAGPDADERRDDPWTRLRQLQQEAQSRTRRGPQHEDPGLVAEDSLNRADDRRDDSVWDRRYESPGRDRDGLDYGGPGR